MKFDNTKSVWYEKYKPQTIEDVILPESIKTRIQEFIKSGNMPNLGLWSVSPGLGKSSTANAIIKDTQSEAMWLNASLESGIDVLRNKIMRFASQQSFNGNFKIVVLDEADNIPSSMQSGLRGFLDEFSQNCRFIFTGNYKTKIIEPLLDRLSNFDFDEFQKTELIKQVFERLKFILNNEGIDYEDVSVALIANKFYPQIRSMIGTLQRFSDFSTKRLVVSEESLNETKLYDSIIESILNKDYPNLINRVNSLSSPENLYSFLYKNAEKYFPENKYPNIVVIIARYQFMSSTVRDKNLNLAACLTELMQLL